MDNRLRIAGIAALICMIIAPIVAMSLGFEGAVIVMIEIAIIAFFTVLFVMIIGSKHDHYPSTVEESASVAAWKQRLAAQEAKKAEQAEQAQNSETETQEATTEATVSSEGKDTGKTVGSLSDEEREAKRQAALERRKARAAQKAADES